MIIWFQWKSVGTTYFNENYKNKMQIQHACMKHSLTKRSSPSSIGDFWHYHSIPRDASPPVSQRTSTRCHTRHQAHIRHSSVLWFSWSQNPDRHSQPTKAIPLSTLDWMGTGKPKKVPTKRKNKTNDEQI